MASGTTGSPSQTVIEFCGECHIVAPDRPYFIGREGDLAVDDNPYLHRRFLVLHNHSGVWWLTNEGQYISAMVTASEAGFTATLPPGSAMPLAFGRSTVVFAAGSTTYELDIVTGAGLPGASEADYVGHGETTLGVPSLTESQKVLIVALAEHVLRRDGTTVTEIPSSAQAAARLGWPLTKFNRKLDNVCDKFAQIGVGGLRAGGGRVASNRKARLVEYAVTSRLVTRADLVLLDAEAARMADPGRR